MEESVIMQLPVAVERGRVGAGSCGRRNSSKPMEELLNDRIVQRSELFVLDG